MVKSLHLWAFTDLILIGLAAIAGATVLYVPGQYPTIQSGLDAASYGDTVLVAPGTYYEYWIMMANGVVLTSSHGVDSTVIDANSLGPVIMCSGVDDRTVISGFTIQHGYYPCAGGIDCYNGASPRIENNWIRDNEAYIFGGGGVYCWGDASPMIVGNRIEANQTSGDGGGIQCITAGSPQIHGNLIIGNVATAYGGGIYATNCFVEIVGNVITNNSAPHYSGGGINLVYADALIYDNIICENVTESGVGGGISVRGAWDVVIARNQIYRNAATKGGGIACSRDARPLIANNTIHGNVAMPQGGGGIYCIDSTSAEIIHNIITEAVHGGGISVADTLSFPLIAYNDVWGNAGGDYLGCESGIGDISEDPLYVGKARNDFRLLWGSPCIDAGHPDSLDPDSTRRDMGALFFDQSTPLSIYVTPDMTMLSPLDTLKVLYTLINITEQPITFWGLARVILPNGEPYARNPILGPQQVTLGAGQIARKRFSHHLPEVAPSGNYEYWAYVGLPPDTVIDYDQVDFIVDSGQ